MRHEANVSILIGCQNLQITSWSHSLFSCKECHRSLSKWMNNACCLVFNPFLQEFHSCTNFIIDMSMVVISKHK